MPQGWAPKPGLGPGPGAGNGCPNIGLFPCGIVLGAAENGAPPTEKAGCVGACVWPVDRDARSSPQGAEDEDVVVGDLMSVNMSSKSLICSIPCRKKKNINVTGLDKQKFSA